MRYGKTRRFQRVYPIGAPGFEPGTSSPPDPGSGWPSVAVSASSTNDATFWGCARRRSVRGWPPARSNAVPRPLLRRAVVSRSRRPAALEGRGARRKGPRTRLPFPGWASTPPLWTRRAMRSRSGRPTRPHPSPNSHLDERGVEAHPRSRACSRRLPLHQLRRPASRRPRLASTQHAPDLRERPEHVVRHEHNRHALLASCHGCRDGSRSHKVSTSASFGSVGGPSHA
jgi:hypothetical protein